MCSKISFHVSNTLVQQLALSEATQNALGFPV